MAAYVPMRWVRDGRGDRGLRLDRLERYVAPEGLRITNSYSPGYCGWNVSEQHALFSLLPEGFCGVRLCESGLMLPIKS